MKFYATCFGARLTARGRSVKTPRFRWYTPARRVGQDAIDALTYPHRIEPPLDALHRIWERSPLELEIQAETFEEATALLSIYRAMLYALNVPPFDVPCIASAGQEEIGQVVNRAADAPLIEIRAVDALGESIRGHDPISAPIARQADEDAAIWTEHEVRFPQLRTVRQVMVLAPQLRPLNLSLLQLWSGLEALFPAFIHKGDQMHAAHRALAELAGEGVGVTLERAEAFRTDAAYGADIQIPEWVAVWSILCCCMRGVLVAPDSLINRLDA